MQLGIKPRYVLVIAVYSQGVLGQVVGAEGDEVDPVLNEVLNGQSRSRRLHHYAHINLLQIQVFLEHYLLGLLKLPHMLNHGQHDAHIGQPHIVELLEGPHLQAEVIGLGEIAPDASPSQHRIMLMGLVLSPLHGPELVGGRIQRPHPDRTGEEGIGHGLDAFNQLIDVLLRLFILYIPVGSLAQAQDHMLYA